VTDAKDRLGDRLGARIVAECEQLARIPGLEARIAELEAERDEARRLLNKNLESSAGVIEQIQAERDEAIYGRKFAEGRRGRAEAERDDARGLADIEAKLANEEHAARERAEAERDAAIKRADETDYAWVVASEKAVQMEAERDRLRAALIQIMHYPFDVMREAHEDRAAMCEIARAALAGEEKPSGGLIPQPTRREMGVDAPDFGPVLGEEKP
jgi:hypothetical protein